MTLLATHTQETFLQSSALEIRLELLLYEIRQRPIGRGAQLAECGIVLLDKLAPKSQQQVLARLARTLAGRLRLSGE